MKGNYIMNISGSLLVGYSFSEAGNPVLIVGKKDKKKAVEIINAFEGDEAVELYKKLVGDKKGLDD